MAPRGARLTAVALVPVAARRCAAAAASRHRCAAPASVRRVARPGGCSCIPRIPAPVPFVGLRLPASRVPRLPFERRRPVPVAGAISPGRTSSVAGGRVAACRASRPVPALVQVPRLRQRPRRG